MRIFIAGGSGVLGRSLIRLLAAAGYEVSATTRSAARAAALRELGAIPVIVDALDRATLSHAVSDVRPTTIVNLLTDLTTGDSASNARLRIQGTRNLVDAAVAAGASRIVAESISWVYSSGTTPVSEAESLDTTEDEPRRSTIAAVTSLESAVREIPEHVVLRFGQLYGPSTWYSRAGRFGQEARAGRLAATETVASFIHTSDAVRAILLALDWENGTWNIVDDEPASGYEWAPHFAAGVGARRPIVLPISGNIGRAVSNARAKNTGLVLEYPTWREGFSGL